MAVADRVMMMENSVYSVASPEAAASIVWRDKSHKAEAAEQLHLTAADLKQLQIIDEVISEPAGGAHTDFRSAAGRLDEALQWHLQDVADHDRGRILENRRHRFLHVGHLHDHRALPRAVPDPAG